LQGWEQCKKYVALPTEKAKRNFVPEPRGEYSQTILWLLFGGMISLT
jgi:hypothetical protein